MSPQERRQLIAAAAKRDGTPRRYGRRVEPGWWLENYAGKNLDVQYPRNGYWTDDQLKQLAQAPQESARSH